MAINKKQTPVWMKAVIIVVALCFAALLVVPSLVGLQPAKNSAGQAGQLDTIAAEYAGTAQSNEQALSADPKNFDLLVAQGNLYFDWADRIQQAAPNTGAQLGYWAAATGYYERALEQTKAVDTGVMTDLSVAYFSAARLNDAIRQIEEVLKVQPEFAPAIMNAGIFYRAAGQNAKALEFFNKYTTLKDVDPNNVQTVRGWIAELQSASGNASAPAPVGTD